MLCYRCNKQISETELFHIDHKQNWIYQPDPKKAFFDLDNIQCSHVHCNIAHRGKKFRFLKVFLGRLGVLK